MRVHVCQHSFLFLHFHLSHSVSLCHRIYAGPRLSALVLVALRPLSLITFSFTLSQNRCGSTSVSTLSCCFTSTFAYHIQFHFVTESMRVHVCQHSFLLLNLKFHFRLSHSVSLLLCCRIEARSLGHICQHSFLLFYFHFHLSRFTYHISLSLCCRLDAGPLPGGTDRAARLSHPRPEDVGYGD